MGEQAVIEVVGTNPGRSELVIERELADRVRTYLLHYTKMTKISSLLVAMTTQQIAQGRDLSLGVVLTRGELLEFVETAKNKLTELEQHDGD